MSVKCNKCGEDIHYTNKDQIKFVCDSCHEHIHEACSGLTATEIRCFPLKNRNLLFLCENCRSCLKSLPKILNQISEMQAELGALRKEIGELNKKSGSAEDTLVEVEDRIVRSRNVIIYNVPESAAVSIGEKIDDDKNTVNNLLANSGVDYSLDKVIRIGKSAINPSKPRPLKVIFTDSSSSKQVLKRKNRITGNSYKIVNDLTVRQR